VLASSTLARTMAGLPELKEDVDMQDAAVVGADPAARTATPVLDVKPAAGGQGGQGGKKGKKKGKK
jgi:hypothetical protein